MKLDNTALYCKGWYRQREGGVRTMWIDLAHCIHADGWSPQTKEDVANWCLHRLDALRKDEVKDDGYGCYKLMSVRYE